MTSISKSALLQYSAAEMYALVADIESYPQFLPWCGGARILRREDGVVTAAIDIAYGGVRKTFTTRNEGQPADSMDMRLVEGPFRRLHGRWRFVALDERSCRISFDIEFEFSNLMLSLLIGPVFHQIANGMMDSFCARAVQLYGRR